MDNKMNNESDESKRVVEQATAVPKTPEPQVIYVQQKVTNSLATAGLVLAIIAIVFSWVPVLNMILWILGLIFSGIGMRKAPRGLAIAGLVLSLITIIIIVAVVGAIAASVPSLF
jgi:uncharacterized membrane protein